MEQPNKFEHLLSPPSFLHVKNRSHTLQCSEQFSNFWPVGVLCKLLMLLLFAYAVINFSTLKVLRMDSAMLRCMEISCDSADCRDEEMEHMHPTIRELSFYVLGTRVKEFFI